MEVNNKAGGMARHGKPAWASLGKAWACWCLTPPALPECRGVESCRSHMHAGQGRQAGARCSHTTHLSLRLMLATAAA
jgi:hypothetical protein